jgi:hypothetical protein
MKWPSAILTNLVGFLAPAPNVDGVIAHSNFGSVAANASLWSDLRLQFGILATKC